MSLRGRKREKEGAREGKRGQNCKGDMIPRYEDRGTVCMCSRTVNRAKCNPTRQKIKTIWCVCVFVRGRQTDRRHSVGGTTVPRHLPPSLKSRGEL